MSEFHFEIQLFGDEELAHTFERIGRRARHMDEVFETIFSQLVNIMGENFLTQGARSGSPWDELKPATIIEKTRLGALHPEDPLIRFGDLFDAASFIPNSGNRASYHGTHATFELTGEAARIGEIHQHGAEVSGIPARPFFRLTHSDREDFVDEMHHFLFRRRVRGFVDTGRPVNRVR